jgi:hypothetical protein
MSHFICANAAGDYGGKFVIVNVVFSPFNAANGFVH